MGGSGGVFPRKFFENFHTVVAILVPFEQFCQILIKFFAPKFECFTQCNVLPLNFSVSVNIMHFVCTFLILRALGVRLIVIEKVRNYGKIVFIKNMFQNGWWGDASPTPPIWIRPCPR